MQNQLPKPKLPTVTPYKGSEIIEYHDLSAMYATYYDRFSVGETVKVAMLGWFKSVTSAKRAITVAAKVQQAA